MPKPTEPVEKFKFIEKLMSSHGFGIITVVICLGTVYVTSFLRLHAERIIEYRDNFSVCMVLFALLEIALLYAMRHNFWLEKKSILQSQQAIKLSEERLNLAVTGMTDGLWDWNIETGDIYYSPRFMALTGHAPHELPCTLETFTSLVHPDDLPRVQQALRNHFKTHAHYRVEYRLRHKHGHYVWCEARGQAQWNSQGRAVRMNGFTMDVSEHKLAEHSLLEARAEAERATRLKSEFLANMSHELRTPMNGVIGMAHLLLSGNLSAKDRNYAKTILQSAENLLYLLNDILDFSKIEAGKIELEHIPFDLKLLCVDVCEIMQSKIEEKQLELLLNYGTDTKRHVIGDPGRVRQILLNLVSNAEKFTEKGSIEITATSSLLSSGHMEFYFEVKDSGIGIPEDKLDYIFNKFSQGDGSTTRKFGGTGLGLAICKDLTRMMGGTIGVRSTLGQGSTFWFRIVLERNESGRHVLEFDPSLSLEGIRVLVVDDNPTARLIAKEQLVAEGCAVVTPESSQEALRLIEAGEHFDAALIDYSMPGMDGMELVKQIKASPSHAQLPVIMVTAMPMREGSQSIQQAGLSGYLCKPLAHQLLREAMLCVVHAKQSGEPLPFITLHSLRESRGSVAAPASRSIALGHARALLAEDNLVNQTVAVKMLERYGFEVVAVHDGQQAVQCFKEDGAFDLVFMDCQMPVMDGYEATAHIRAIETASSRARTPVIAFTANAIKGDDQKCFDAGMDDYLSKPIDLSALEKLLKKWTRQDNRISAVRSAEPTDSEGGAATLNEAVFKRFSDMVGSELRPLMKAHQASCEQYLRELNAALDNKDMAALARAAHTLKSSSANLGAARTVELARRLESMARGKVQDTEELRSLAQALEAETHRSSRAILSRMAGS